MEKSVFINKEQIVECTVEPKTEYVETRFSSHKRIYKKGEKIDYFFPRFFRKKYADQDYFRRWLSLEREMMTREEMNKEIREDYKEYFGNVLVEENGIIYRRPFVRIVMAAKDVVHKIYFDTEKECEDYIREQGIVNWGLHEIKIQIQMKE